MAAPEEEGQGPRREAGPEGPRREAGPEGPVIRDRRRIDPVTGQVREAAQSPGASQASRGTGQARPGKHSASKPGSLRTEAAGPAGRGDDGSGQAGGSADAGGTGDGSSGSSGADSDLAVKLAERTADLQRVQAEYANYRKRVDRDRVAVRELALAGVLAELLPVLDDIGRAREHEKLTGGFKAVADALEAATAKLGLTTFGEAGDTFDPNVHEALMHAYSADVTEPTCVQVLQPGYKVGERILRPARVAVAEPTDPAGSRPADSGEPPQEGDEGDASDEAGTPAAADDRAPDEGD